MKLKKEVYKKNKEQKNIYKKDNAIVEYLKNYKELFFRKQILFFIIGLLIFFIAFSIGMSIIDFSVPLKRDINEIANIKLLQLQFVFIMILTPFLALIPYIKKMSIITIFYAYFMGFNIANMFYLPTCNNILLAIFVILSLFALSINIVLSFELSEKINKKFLRKLKIKSKKNDKEANNENNTLMKEEISEKFKRKVVFITFIINVMIVVINLIITSFI